MTFARFRIREVISAAFLTCFVLVAIFGATGCQPGYTSRTTETARFRIPKSVPNEPQHPLAVDVPGLANFGFITPELWRGAEPTAAGIKVLEGMGVKTIIDLREGDESAEISPKIRYVRLPVSPFQADHVDVTGVLRAISESPKPVFIHCREGRDRTGLAIAAYRLSQGMSAEAACQELRNFHVNPWWRGPIQDRVYQLERDGFARPQASTHPVISAISTARCSLTDR
jgi:protein tyrosine phosphatase (PTP) superfamily phosphohydrolase (DUF442 family)